MTVAGANQSFLKSAFAYLPASPTPGVPFSRFMECSARVQEALDHNTGLDKLVTPYPADAPTQKVHLQNELVRSAAVELNAGFRRSQGWREGSQLSLEDVQQTAQRTVKALESSHLQEENRMLGQFALGLGAFPVAFAGLMGLTSIPLGELSSHLVAALCWGAAGIGGSIASVGFLGASVRSGFKVEGLARQLEEGRQTDKGCSEWLVALNSH